jgi:purine-nucleoside phosphorylase
MYKHWTISELKNALGLPQDYTVDACIVYGGWDENKCKKLFLSTLKNKKYKIEKLNEGFIKKILSINLDGKRIWFIVEYGGARLSEFVHFASMLGSKINVLVGSCGTLKKGLNPLTIVVPTGAYSTESSCHMYLRNKKDNLFISDKDLSDKARRLLAKNFDVESGKIITCQAMMAETWEDICKWAEDGYIGVEMESSTIFSVSEHFKVKSTAILHIADNLIEKETIETESYKKRKSELKKIKAYNIQTALDLVLSEI